MIFLKFLIHEKQILFPLWLIIGHVWYINILIWLRGFRVKHPYLVLFSLYLSLSWEFRNKRNLKNLQFLPESLGAMLEYWYIERGPLQTAAPLLGLAKLFQVDPRHPRIIFAAFRATFLMPRICFKPSMWYIEMHYVKTFFFSVLSCLFRTTWC